VTVKRLIEANYKKILQKNRELLLDLAYEVNAAGKELSITKQKGMDRKA